MDESQRNYAVWKKPDASLQKWVHIVWFYLYDILENEKLYDIKQINGCLGEGVMEFWEKCLTKEGKEMGWYVHHLKCGDDLMNVYMCQN